MQAVDGYHMIYYMFNPYIESRVCWFLKCRIVVVLNKKTLKEEAALTERAENQMTEAKSLKQISFPEMDSDGLPSSYVQKVLTCLSKWQMKMEDLNEKFKVCGNKNMMPQLGFAS